MVLIGSGFTPDPSKKYIYPINDIFLIGIDELVFLYFPLLAVSFLVLIIFYKDLSFKQRYLKFFSIVAALPGFALINFSYIRGNRYSELDLGNPFMIFYYLFSAAVLIYIIVKSIITAKQKDKIAADKIKSGRIFNFSIAVWAISVVFIIFTFIITLIDSGFLSIKCDFDKLIFDSYYLLKSENVLAFNIIAVFAGLVLLYLPDDALKDRSVKLIGLNGLGFVVLSVIMSMATILEGVISLIHFILLIAFIVYFCFTTYCIFKFKKKFK